MTNTITVSNDLQDQVLDSVRKGQEAVVEAVRAWADAVQRMTTDLPAMQHTVTGNVPTIPGLPDFAANLPTAESLVAQTYDFAAKALENQREFTENLIRAARPANQPAVVETAVTVDV